MEPEGAADGPFRYINFIAGKKLNMKVDGI